MAFNYQYSVFLPLRFPFKILIVSLKRIHQFRSFFSENEGTDDGTLVLQRTTAHRLRSWSLSICLFFIISQDVDCLSLWRLDLCASVFHIDLADCFGFLIDIVPMLCCRFCLLPAVLQHRDVFQGVVFLWGTNQTFVRVDYPSMLRYTCSPSDICEAANLPYAVSV